MIIDIKTFEEMTPVDQRLHLQALIEDEIIIDRSCKASRGRLEFFPAVEGRGLVWRVLETTLVEEWMRIFWILHMSGYRTCRFWYVPGVKILVSEFSAVLNGQAEIVRVIVRELGTMPAEL